MKITKFRNELKTLVGDLGYNLYYGSKNQYNVKREIANKEVILEPFVLRLQTTGVCFYDTTITLWIGVRREIYNEFVTQQEGEKTEFADYMLVEAGKIFDKIASHKSLIILQAKQEIDIRYYEADQSQTVNTQSFISMTLPIRIYG
jgi:hypothetical protein